MFGNSRESQDYGKGVASRGSPVAFSQSMLCLVADQLADGENLPFLLRKMRGVAQKVEGELELAV